MKTILFYHYEFEIDIYIDFFFYDIIENAEKRLTHQIFYQIK